MLENGYEVVLLNAIGSANMDYTSPEYTNLSTNTEFMKCLAEVRKQAPDADLFAIGMSLGANRMLKLAGQERKYPFKAFVSISNPFDLVKVKNHQNMFTWEREIKYVTMIRQNFIMRPDLYEERLSKFNVT